MRISVVKNNVKVNVKCLINAILLYTVVDVHIYQLYKRAK